MSESKFETVSSCIDDYQQYDESFDDTFDEMIKDNQLSDTWQRYHLLGDIMRNDVPESLHLDLSDKIAQAIEQEPTVLAPKVSKTQSPTLLQEFKGKVVQFAKPFGQLAIAASAAGLMVLGVQQNNVVNNDILMPNQTIQTNPLGGIAEPVSFNYEQASRQSQKQAYLQQQRRFQALLSDHQQQIKFNAVIDDAVMDNEQAPQEKVEDLPK